MTFSCAFLIMIFQQVARKEKKNLFFASVVTVNYGLGGKSAINLITFSLIVTSQHNLPACLPSNSNIYS